MQGISSSLLMVSSSRSKHYQWMDSMVSRSRSKHYYQDDRHASHSLWQVDLVVHITVKEMLSKVRKSKFHGHDSRLSTTSFKLVIQACTQIPGWITVAANCEPNMKSMEHVKAESPSAANGEMLDWSLFHRTRHSLRFRMIPRVDKDFVIKFAFEKIDCTSDFEVHCTLRILAYC